MDDSFEAGLLALVDDALTSPRTVDAYKHFEQSYGKFEADMEARATAQVRRWWIDGRPVRDTAEYMKAHDRLLPRERYDVFLNITERLEWTGSAQFELTEQDRADGYRSVDEFWPFLKDWREQYRRTFAR